MTVRARVIPCLDVADGRVVKGVNFVELRDAGDPVEQARAYDAAGADELCFLDIGASHEGRGTILDVVRRTAAVCFMPLTVGGGVRTADDARALLLAGALVVPHVTPALGTDSTLGLGHAPAPQANGGDLELLPFPHLDTLRWLDTGARGPKVDTLMGPKLDTLVDGI